MIRNLLHGGIFCRLQAMMFLCATVALSASAQVTMHTNPETGGISQLNLADDPEEMNWLTATDGSQYAWIIPDYAWGLGYTTLTCEHGSTRMTWNHPTHIDNDGQKVVYQMGDLTLNVTRQLEGGELTERYLFTNNGGQTIALSETGIYTPFNDNYPGSHECIHRRTDAHIWAGGSAAYVNALRMGGFGPHLGLAVTEGAIEAYEIWERDKQKQHSQTRGLMAMCLPYMVLRPGESYALAWRVFEHDGNADFKQKLLQKGSVLVESGKYVYTKGETASVSLYAGHPLDKCEAKLNGVPINVTCKGNKYTATVPLLQEGEARFDFTYDGGKHTHALCLVTTAAEDLIDSRTTFIRTRQQLDNPNDLRNDAYMVYDNESDSIYLNDTPNCSPIDRDEGAERIGMGLLLAHRYLQTKDGKLKESVLRYVKFVREKLQTEDYRTYSTVDHKKRNRGYNYMWAAKLFFYAYQITGEKRYANDGFQTIQSLYNQFGYGFYSIEIPVIFGLNTLKAAGMDEEYAKLLKDFEQCGEIFIKNGLDYPKHEVNFEQSIVAPAVCFLEQLYIVTGEQKYLDEAKRQLPVMEAFNGFQPNYHLNDIAIRHWDGYWFGKREMFGDTFPHYWSTITATAFHYYAEITGDESYQHRAENIVRNNLCLFTKDGRGSCAYLFPHRVNGINAQFYDEYANDQDWALYYYLLVNEKSE